MQKNTFTILVVEDERPLLEAIRIKLMSSNIETVTCRSVQQALSYLKDIHSIDAIWLDHFLMGTENGLDLVTKIKEENSLYKAIPIFVVSNTASNEKVSAYMQLGVEKYYVKSNSRLDDIVLDIKEKLLKSSEEVS